jgi:hypothetical protein
MAMSELHNFAGSQLGSGEWPLIKELGLYLGKQFQISFVELLVLGSFCFILSLVSCYCC